MVFPLQREDVGRHLNELGYKNITEEQLDEFVKDLRRLIRYEEKQKRLKGLIQIRQNESRRRKEKDISPERCSSESSGHFSSSECDQPDLKQQKQRRHEQRHQSVSYSSDVSSKGETSSSTSTSSSNLEEKKNKVKIKIKLDDKEPNFDDRKPKTGQKWPKYDEKKPKIVEKASKTESKRSSKIEEKRSKIDEFDFDPPKFVRPKSGSIVYEQILPKQPEFPAKATCSFIRPPPDRLIPKSDPVRLYRYYKECWDKTKFPGDDSTKALRWRVREWMMGHRE